MARLFFSLFNHSTRFPMLVPRLRSRLPRRALVEVEKDLCRQYDNLTLSPSMQTRANGLAPTQEPR